MLTVVDPTGLRAGAQAVVGALALMPVSLVPALSPASGSPLIYCVWALVLGAAQLAAAVAVSARTATTARPAGCCGPAWCTSSAGWACC